MINFTKFREGMTKNFYNSDFMHFWHSLEYLLRILLCFLYLGIKFESSPEFDPRTSQLWDGNNFCKFSNWILFFSFQVRQKRTHMVSFPTWTKKMKKFYSRNHTTGLTLINSLYTKDVVHSLLDLLSSFWIYVQGHVNVW